MDPELDAIAAEFGEAYGYSMPVARLLALDRPDLSDPDAWKTAAEVGLGPEHVPEIIRVMTDERWDEFDSELPEVYAPVHAWRVLADLRAEEAIPALIGLFPRIDKLSDDWLGEEAPVVLGIIGPAAIPALITYLDEHGEDLWGCVEAAHSLQEIAARHPEARGRCVEILMARLERHAEQDPTLNAFLLRYLLDLRALEAIPLMKAAFDADRVDLFVQGDWEDVEIELGLRQERSTPPRDYIRELLRDQAAREVAAERRADREARAAKKAKRKQAGQTRKKARQRKKR